MTRDQSTLAIKHIPGSNPAHFQVLRLYDGKTSESVQVPSPVGFQVKGRPQSDLLLELQWYLEEFLDYPFSPETERADHVIKALRDWGEQVFQKLFDNRQVAHSSLVLA